MTPSVVVIRSPSRAPRSVDGAPQTPSRSGGSGVIIDAAGFILTNDHVVSDGTKFEITTSDGQVCPGVVWARDVSGDLALVKIAARGALTAAPLGDSQALAQGEPVIAVGNALGLAQETGEPSASFGIVSALRRFQGGSRVYGDAIQFDAPVNPGNSGGGLFDLEGRLLGLTGRISVRGRQSRNVGVGFAVPAHQIALALPALKEGRDLEHGFLGVRFRRDAPGPGVPVISVVPGSPADEAGFRAGDLLIDVDGTPLEHAVRLQNILSVQPDGATIAIRYRRGLEEQTVKVRLRGRGKDE